MNQAKNPEYRNVRVDITVEQCGLLLYFHEILLHHFRGPVIADVTVSELHKCKGGFE